MLSSEPLIIKHIDDPDFTVTLRSDGIVYVFFKDGMEITVPVQGRLLVAYHEVTGGILHPFIFETGVDTSINKEARDNAVLMEDRSPVGRSAVVANNTAHLLIANFYLKFNKPKNPYKVFKSRDEAIKWLKSFS
jgi:hypothetical protein